MVEPLVSVIITTYKRSDLLVEAINSVLKQDYNNLEIIVIDDNDPNSEYRNKTEFKMKRFKENDLIHYIKHTENKNGAAARNTGLKHASGKFVTYLDDDDTYRYNKVSEQVKFLQKNPTYKANYCGWKKDGRNYAPTSYGDLSLGVLSGETPIITNSIMMNKDIAIEIGGWDETFNRNQEAAYMLNYFKHGYKIGVIDDILIDFDTSDRSNVSNPKKSEKEILYFLDVYKDYLNALTHNNKKLKKEVLATRALSTMLNYLSNHLWIDSLRVLVKSLKRFPLIFINKTIVYVLNKLRTA